MRSPEDRRRRAPVRRMCCRDSTSWLEHASLSRSPGFPWPSSIDFRIRSAHPSPLQQGVQKPQDSRAKKLCHVPRHTDRTGVVIEHDHGAGAQAAAGFGHLGEVHGRIQVLFDDERSVETPPGSNPRNFNPSRIPPACSSRISRAVVPIGSSQRPGRFTFPLTPYSLVPPSFVRPRPRNHSAPWLMMWGTQLIVSTLLTTVGLPNRPTTGGNGGFDLGLARLPSSAFSSPGLIPANVTAAAEVKIELQAVAGTEDVLSQVMTFVGFRDGARKPLRGQRVFSAQKDVGNVGFDGESGDDRAFYELVRIPLHQHPVFERAGLHFVGVDHQISRVGNVFTDAERKTTSNRFENRRHPGRADSRSSLHR